MAHIYDPWSNPVPLYPKKGRKKKRVPRVKMEDNEIDQGLMRFNHGQFEMVQPNMTDLELELQNPIENEGLQNIIEGEV